MSTSAPVMRNRLRRNALSVVLALWLSPPHALGATFPSQAPFDDASVDLSGTWKSHVGDDPRWAEARYDDSDWKRVTLPSTWFEQGYEGVEGYIWFRREVFLPSPGARNDLGVMVGASRFGSYEVYAAGTRIGGRIVPSSRLVKQEGRIYTVLPDAVDASGRLSLCLRVWRDGLISDAFPDMGPVGKTMMLGELDTLRTRVRLERQGDLLADLSHLLLAIFFTAVGLHHLVLFRHRERSDFLWFGLTAVGFAIDSFVTSPWVYELTQWAGLVIRIEQAAIHSTAAAFIQFFWSFFSRPIGRALRAYQISHLALAVLGFVTPLGLLMGTVDLRWLWLTPLVIAMVVVVAKLIREGHREARPIGLGVFVLVAVVCGEAATQILGWQSITPLPGWAFLFLVTSLALSLSNRFRGLYAELDELRKRLEKKVAARTAELRQHEASYRDLVENIEEMICTHDMKGRVLSANDALVRKLGAKSPEDVVGRRIQDVLSPDVRDRFDSYLTTILESGHAQGLMKIRLRGGAERILEYSNTLREASADADAPPVIVGVSRDVTERVRAERALRESESRFRALVEQAADALFLYDREGRFIDVNERACESLEYTRDELMKLSVMDVEQSPSLHELDEFWKRLQTEAPVTVDGIHRRKDGTEFPVELRIGMLERGGKSYFLALARDITERKRIEEGLKNSEERFKALFEHAPDAYYLNDLKGNFVNANRAAEEMIGYRKEELIGRNFLKLSLLPAGQIPKAALLLGKNNLGQPTGPDEFTLNRKDGTQVFVEIRTAPVAMDNRTSVLGLARDITERKQAESELRRHHDQLKQMVEERTIELGAANEELVSELVERKRAEHALRGSEASLAEAQRIAHVGNWEWEMSTNDLRWSDEVYRIFGLNRQQFTASHESFLNCVHPDDRDFVDKAHAEATHARGLDGIDYRIHLPEGMVRTVRERAEVGSDELGKPVRMVGTVQDITEQRALEERLRQALKMEAVGRLAGGVAHDFNNLLTVILGHGELLTRDLPSGDRRRDDIRQIRRAAERASSLTQQLLAFSRRQVRRPTVLNLNSSVTDVEKMLRRLIGEDIQVLMVLEPDLDPIEADRGQIEQVILNLALNARDAMPKGGKLVFKSSNVELSEAFAARHDGATPGHHVLLEVSDTGVGIASEALSHLFEPFFTSKEQGKGTGLGLASVYGIVKQSGGYVGVESEVGQGTTFRVYLPHVARAGDVEAPDLLSKGAPVGGSEIILVVEDEIAIRSLIRKFLETQGYTVLTARDGLEALRVLDDQENSIDLLLTDMVMPV